MLCVDTNVWIYYLDAKTPEHDEAREDLRRVLRDSDRGILINTVVQLEVVHHLVKRKREWDGSAEAILSLEATHVEPVTAKTVGDARELLEDHHETGIGGRDASLVASMDENGVSEIWSHDEGLKRLGERLGWLDVYDPV